MRRAWATVLLLLVALGAGCAVWLVWTFVRDLGSSPMRAEEDTPTAPTRALREEVEAESTLTRDELLALLARWARSPEELARWKDAYAEDASMFSPFERRLWIGRPLECLSAELDAGAFPPDRAQRLFRRHFLAGVLDVEQTDSLRQALLPLPGEPTVAIRPEIDMLVRPRRARDAFVLHGREDEPFSTGRDLRLRAWTPRGVSVAPARVDEARALLERLDVVAGVDRPASIDVLATPRGGRDVFPTLSDVPFSFAGLYLLRDRLAVVDTHYPPVLFRRLLHHEVTHAWHDAALPRWRATFAVEGLATYVSWIEPTDAGLAYPAIRLENDFAWLLDAVAWLERHGYRLPPRVGRLVRVRPYAFYGLGWFGYAVAEACYAYVGADAIQAALRRDDPEALLVRFEAIEWADLLAWMRGRSGRGRASDAFFVTESPVPGGEGEEESGTDRTALDDLGIDVPAERIQEVVAEIRGRAGAGTRDGSGRTPGRPPEEATDAQGPTYVGVSACVKCHLVQYQSWKQRAHARAWSVLAPGEAVEAKRAAGLDPDRDFRSGGACFRCHTTGYGTSSGYPVPRPGTQRTDELDRRVKEHAGVGCEACHGPGGAYVPYKEKHEDYVWEDIAARGAYVPICEVHCARCHTPGCPTMPSGYTFDFEAARRSDSLHEHRPLQAAHGRRER